jgi:hypothetical protein
MEVVADAVHVMMGHHIEDMDGGREDGGVFVPKSLLGASFPNQLDKALVLRRDEKVKEREGPEDTVGILDDIDNLMECLFALFQSLDFLGNINVGEPVSGEALLDVLHILHGDTLVTLRASV